MMDAKAIVSRVLPLLRQLFPECGISVFPMKTHHMFADIVSEDCVALKFQHLPAIAEAFGTEALDFQSWYGDRLIDSVTFDGCAVVRIIAKYT